MTRTEGSFGSKEQHVMRERLQTSETLVALDQRNSKIGNDIKDVYDEPTFDCLKHKSGRSNHQILTTFSTNKMLSNVVSQKQRFLGPTESQLNRESDFAAECSQLKDARPQTTYSHVLPLPPKPLNS